jgi:hypothetical protein
MTNSPQLGLIRIISILEVCGGLYALWMTITAFTVWQQSGDASAAQAMVMFAQAGALSSLAGTLLWFANPKGYALSIAVQLVQVPIVSTSVFLYSVFMPLRVAILWTQQGLRFNLDAGGEFFWGIGTIQASDTYFGVNIFAVLVAGALWKARTQFRRAYPSSPEGIV